MLVPKGFFSELKALCKRIQSVFPCSDGYKDFNNRYYVERKNQNLPEVGDYGFKEMNIVELDRSTNGNCIQDCLAKMNLSNGYGAGPYPQTLAADICRRNPSILVLEDEENFYFHFYNIMQNPSSLMMLYRGHATIVSYQGNIDKLVRLSELVDYEGKFNTFDSRVVYNGWDPISCNVLMKAVDNYPGFTNVFTGMVDGNLFKDKRNAILTDAALAKYLKSPFSKEYVPPQTCISSDEVLKNDKVDLLSNIGRKDEYFLPTFLKVKEDSEARKKRMKLYEEAEARIRESRKNKERALVLHPTRVAYLSANKWREEFLEKKRIEKVKEKERLEKERYIRSRTERTYLALSYKHTRFDLKPKPKTKNEVFEDLNEVSFIIESFIIEEDLKIVQVANKIKQIRNFLYRPRKTLSLAEGLGLTGDVTYFKRALLRSVRKDVLKIGLINVGSFTFKSVMHLLKELLALPTLKEIFIQGMKINFKKVKNISCDLPLPTHYDMLIDLASFSPFQKNFCYENFYVKLKNISLSIDLAYDATKRLLLYLGDLNYYKELEDYSFIALNFCTYTYAVKFVSFDGEFGTISKEVVRYNKILHEYNYDDICLLECGKNDFPPLILSNFTDVIKFKGHVH